MALDANTQLKLQKVIESKVKHCPHCNNRSFILADGYTARVLQDDMNSIKTDGHNITSVTVICDKCGYIMDFSLGILGLLNNKDEKKDDKKQS